MGLKNSTFLLYYLLLLEMKEKLSFSRHSNFTLFWKPSKIFQNFLPSKSSGILIGEGVLGNWKKKLGNSQNIREKLKKKIGNKFKKTFAL